MNDPLLAIFVGGRSSRMGRDKGLLLAPGAEATLLESLVDAGGRAGLSVALIGDAAPYASVVPEVPRVDDRPRGAGPLGGLGGALDFAGSIGLSRLIAVACDMPYVTAPVLRLLVEHPSTADVLAPRRGDGAPWEPMLARYEVARVAAVLDETLRRGQRSFQSLFKNLAIDALPLSLEVREALTDWDAPQDVPR